MEHEFATESTDYFETLIHFYRATYATSHPHHMTFAALVNLRQGGDEPLCKFVERFFSISVKIRSLNLKVALYSMLMALRLKKLADNLYKTPSQDINELQHKVVSYIQMEEMSEFQNEI